MAVGVPENDVFAAADAVLARGERPTVERVRLELGRGSPARVGALLDQWWEQLAGRLRGETRLPGLPAEVAQAFVAIWQQATLLAQGVAEQSLAGQRQVLAEEREELAVLDARARLEAAQARQQTAEALAARQGAETRLSDLEQLLVQRLAQIDDLRQQREELLDQCDEARQQLVEARQQLQDSRQQAEQAREQQQRYTRDVENRAYREIDRAREESKTLGGSSRKPMAVCRSCNNPCCQPRQNWPRRANSEPPPTLKSRLCLTSWMLPVRRATKRPNDTKACNDNCWARRANWQLFASKRRRHRPEPKP